MTSPQKDKGGGHTGLSFHWRHFLEFPVSRYTLPIHSYGAPDVKVAQKVTGPLTTLPGHSLGPISEFYHPLNCPQSRGPHTGLLQLWGTYSCDLK